MQQFYSFVSLLMDPDQTLLIKELHSITHRHPQLLQMAGLRSVQQIPPADLATLQAKLRGRFVGSTWQHLVSQQREDVTKYQQGTGSADEGTSTLFSTRVVDSLFS